MERSRCRIYWEKDGEKQDVITFSTQLVYKIKKEELPKNPEKKWNLENCTRDDKKWHLHRTIERYNKSKIRKTYNGNERQATTA